MFNTPHDFDERTEIAIHEVTKALVEAKGATAVMEMTLPYFLRNEDRMREKFGSDHAGLQYLDQYKEDVMLGKRESLVLK